jgi:ubiquinone/menaquinone biosynthesis C-methylase UbiE
MTTQFDGLAATYADARPDYPDAAMRYVLESLAPAAGARVGTAATPALRVVDVGHGTGISANALLRAAATMTPPRTLHIEGVEPGADMRRVAGERGLQIAALHATRAEATDLTAHAWDLVMCAQTFHWCDAQRALAEFHRVLVPAGRLALIWNLRQEGIDPLTDAYNRVVTTSAQLDPLQASRRAELAQPLRQSNQFSNIRQAEFPNPQRVTQDGLLQRATSASYFPRTEPERSSALAQLREAFGQYASSGTGWLLHTCQVTLATA